LHVCQSSSYMRKIWGVGWGQSTISSMFLNRDPEFTGESSSTPVNDLKFQLSCFKGKIAHWRILLRQWDID
jgi:hypothetical protein